MRQCVLLVQVFIDFYTSENINPIRVVTDYHSLDLC